MKVYIVVPLVSDFEWDKPKSAHSTIELANIAGSGMKQAFEVVELEVID